MTSTNTSPLLSFLLTHEEAFKSRARLASLYSDFRAQASTNPDGYVANVSAWRKALADAARAGLLPGGDLLVVKTGEELLRELEMAGWGRPGALGAVVNDAVAKGEMIPLAHFLQQRHSIYSRNRISPWSVLTWGLRQLGVLGAESSSEDRLVVGEFVVKANVEVPTSLLSDLSKSASTSGPALIHSRSTFAAALSHCFSMHTPLTDRDTDILLTHLSRDLHSCAYEPISGTIKFVAPNQSISAFADLDPVSENDVAIARLKSLILALEMEVPALEVRVAALDTAAREAVVEKNTAKARASLRSKKLAAATLEKRRETLHQLQDVYARIEAAADNVEIVRVMQASAGVLRDLNREIGGAEGAEEVVDKLRDEMERADEVTGVLTEGAVSGAVDEGEVDEEFEALEKEESEKEEKEEAEKTKARFEELEKLEKERKEKEEAQKEDHVPDTDREQEAQKESVVAS
ncbi:hypothetical protein NA57DRAFT_33354 [Rhizodiscina lignyota]|uniref:Snf7-domain-containing protein n=1 Tax=Rhizodiscina lignyota TaxID=1504668 RepID=A0A9P4MA87_9PEZI|nr:hypothetical protein NA57DRAFT_33354 [Rhizodiscina lignyota]